MVKWWIGGAVALVALILGIFVIQWVTAPVRGKLSAREQINSGSNRIAQYEHFFNLCAAVQSDEARLEAQYTSLDETFYGTDQGNAETRAEVSRINANIAGISSDRADAINQYNADARKSYTSGQFRSSQLPYQLDDAPYERGGTRTSCVV